jgi:hypothetical protein
LFELKQAAQETLNLRQQTFGFEESEESRHEWSGTRRV